MAPGDAFLNVGVGVLKAGRLAGLAADQTVQVGSGLVAATLLHGVALGASLDEDLLALLGVSWHASVGRECAVEPTDEGVMKSLVRAVLLPLHRNRTNENELLPKRVR